MWFCSSVSRMSRQMKDQQGFSFFFWGGVTFKTLFFSFHDVDKKHVYIAIISLITQLPSFRSGLLCRTSAKAVLAYVRSKTAKYSAHMHIRKPGKSYNLFHTAKASHSYNSFFFCHTHTLTDTHTSTCTCNLTSSPEGSRISISNKQRFHNRYICRNIHHIVLLRLPQAERCRYSAGFSERGSKICRVCRLGAKLCKQITRGARQVFGC